MKKLINLYENPTEIDIDRISEDIEFAKQHQKNLDDGFTVVGSYNKDTPGEKIAIINLKSAGAIPMDLSNDIEIKLEKELAKLPFINKFKPLSGEILTDDELLEELILVDKFMREFA